MKLFPQGVTKAEVRAALLEWLDMLANNRFAEAVDFISPEIPDGSGSTSDTKWTPALLEAVIANYGLDQPIEGETWRYRTAPLTDDLLPEFDKRLDIDFEMWEDAAPDGSRLAGAIHADMPLVREDGPDVSDCTARFVFKHFPDGQMALVLLDIHVL
jgi:hypothetical protein